MLKAGVYTVECPQCKSSTIVHLASDGSINPHRCSKCEVEFEGIGSGKQRHSFVGLIKKAEEIKKTSETNEETKKTVRNPFEGFKFTKKPRKESFKIWKER